MAAGSEEGDACGCTGDPVRAEKDPAYRRALWIVVLLNLGFGAIEIIGGFIANSQALKADSLDFIGDGTITLAGLVAIGWTAQARTRVAVAQGLFLLTLGLGVIGVALWRALTAIPPEAELMGAIGIVALLVNLTSAAVLSKFREGVRAVWLFSRNDAIANVAVIFAAGLVAWTGEAWPDLAVAAVIAALFLHSAYEILRGAHTELRELSTVAG